MRDAHAWVEQRWPRAAHNILIVKSANGAEIISALKRELPGVVAIPVSTDRITRAIAASAPLESGNILLPGHAAADTSAGYHAPDWVANLIEEAALFPDAKHDDQVDAFSQAINCARTHSSEPARGYVARGPIPENTYALGLASPHHPQPANHHLQRNPSLPRRAHTLEELATQLGARIF